MPREATLFLDLILAILLAILLYLVYRKIISPQPILKSLLEQSRELLQQREELKEEQLELKKQFVLGELDHRHYKIALNRNLEQLNQVERKLKQLGFGS